MKMGKAPNNRSLISSTRIGEFTKIFSTFPNFKRTKFMLENRGQTATRRMELLGEAVERLAGEADGP